MRLCCLSDMHGYLPDHTMDCDLVLIAGDICAGNNADKQHAFLKGEFNDWCKKQPAPVICIGGNHDAALFNYPKRDFKNCNFTYLEDDSLKFQGEVIYGLPWTPPWKEGHNWAYRASAVEMAIICEKIPDNTTILLTHIPPFGILDAVQRQNGNYENCGSSNIMGKVYDIDPKIHIFGHIHEGNGVKQIKGLRTVFVNAAIMINEDGHMKPKNRATYIEI